MAETAKFWRSLVPLSVPGDRHLRRVRSFVRNYRTVLDIGLTGQARPIRGVVGLDFLGASTASAIVTFISVFSDRVLGQASFVVPLLGVEISSRIMEVVILAAVVGILVAVGTWASYLSAVRVRAVGREAHAEIMEQIFRRLTGVRQSRPGSGRRYTRQDVSQQLLRNAIQIGIAAEMVIRSFRPAAYCLMAGGTIFVIAPFLTAALLPLGLLVAPVLYWVGARVIADSRDFFDARVGDYGRRVNTLVADIDTSGVPFPPPPALGYVRSDRAVTSYLDAYDRFQLANDKMNLVVGLAQALLLAAATIAFGYYVLVTGERWGILVAYIFGLMLVVTNLRTLVSHLASFNRFYPNVVGFLEFWHRTAEWSALDTSVNHKVLKLCCEMPVFPGSVNEMDLVPGLSVYYLHPMPPARLQFADFVAPLVTACGGEAPAIETAAFAGESRRFVPGTLSQNLALPEERCWEALQIFGVTAEVKTLADGLATPMDETTWSVMSPELQRAIKVIPLLAADSRVVFIEYPLLNKITLQQRDFLLLAMRDRIVFVTSTQAIVMEGDWADQVVVADKERLLGIGNLEWYKAVRAGVLEHLVKAKTSVRGDFDPLTAILT